MLQQQLLRISDGAVLSPVLSVTPAVPMNGAMPQESVSLKVIYSQNSYGSYVFRRKKYFRSLTFVYKFLCTHRIRFCRGAS